MRTVGHYESDVVTVELETPVPDVADLMDQEAVGCVVVVDAEGRPLGILTDRDLLCRVVAAGRDADKTRAGEVMSAELVTATADDPLVELVRTMRAHRVRRLPILRAGRVTGLASLDDVIQALSSDLWNLSETTRVGVRDARRTAWRRRMREHRDEALEELRTQAVHLGHDTREFLKRELANLLESIRRGGA